MWRHTWWKPIVCPGCENEFHIEKKQWKRISLPVLISVAALLAVQFFGEHFIVGGAFLLAYSLVFAVFIIVGLWWLHTVLTKLKFERRVET